MSCLLLSEQADFDQLIKYPEHAVVFYGPDLCIMSYGFVAAQNDRFVFHCEVKNRLITDRKRGGKFFLHNMYPFRLRDVVYAEVACCNKSVKIFLLCCVQFVEHIEGGMNIQRQAKEGSR